MTQRDRLKLDDTLQLHEQLEAFAAAEPAHAQSALVTANRELAERRLTFGREKPLEAALTTLLLDDADVQLLKQTAESLHAIIEKVLDYATANHDRLARFFPDHARVFPFLAKTAGCDTWQIASRYDMAVTPTGELKLLELNTGCPGGLMIAQAMSDVSRHAFAELPAPLAATNDDWPGNATVRDNVLARELLAIESEANLSPDTIAILNDENDLVFELDLLAASFAKQNRQAVVADARSLRMSERQLLLNDQRVTLTYNKFRISTPGSPNHCWQDGFDQRYAAYLHAQQNGCVASVNNLVAMVLAEDKSLLRAVAEPDVLALLDSTERDLVDRHWLWTARLADQPVVYDGNTVDLLSLLRAHQDRFVVKPANEGRGFGVVVGRFASPSEWQRACQIDPLVPKIVQEFTDSAQLRVVCGKAKAGDDAPAREIVQVRDMFLTLGLTIIRGKYHGLISRVSANPVTNVAREGFGQAVFCR